MKHSPFKTGSSVVIAASVGALAAMQLAVTPSLGAQTPAALNPRLAAIADSFVALNRFQGPTGPWGEQSDAARLALESRQDKLAAALREVNRADLTAPNDIILYSNLTEVNDARRASRVCRYHLWNGTNAFAGWHNAASNAARTQAVGTDAARQRALGNFRQLPAAIRAERALLARGLDSGYTASRAVIAQVIRQLDDLLPSDIRRSPLYAPADRDSSEQFRQEWHAMLADSVYPMAREYRSYLQDEYAPRARAEGSLKEQPNGVACYEADLRLRTSVRANVDSLMRDARQQYEQIAKRLAPIVRELTGENDLGRGIMLLRSDARFTFPSRDSVLAAYRAMTKVAESRIGRVVAGVSPESLAVMPYAAFQENAGLPPQYQRKSVDGSVPAQFLVNLGRTERMSVANAVSHEAYPGHHLQRLTEVRAPAVHPVMRSLSVSGFTEGWGIYSEALGDEMGLYPTTLDRAGYLVHLLDVTVAMYLDVGFHAHGWTRQMLIDTMTVIGGRPPAMAAAYADRHAATPGQLATYYVGYRAIQAAREYAERELGAKFRAPEFHQQMLNDGPVTLASMRENVERRVRESRRGG